MALAIPPLVASGGELAVVYRAAAYLWGSWGATYPEGVEPPPMEEGRALGYVGDLEHDVTDLGSRCWVRQDVTVDGVERYSSVPAAFENADTRTAGDTFCEDDIGPEGLGHLVPLVDFHENDIVPVLVAGKVLDLPVTEIAMRSAVGDELGWGVHVGGQITGDMPELEARNAALERQIAKETRDLQQQLAGEREARIAAISSTAETLRGEVTTAVNSEASARQSEISTATTNITNAYKAADAAAAKNNADKFTSLTNAIMGRNTALDSAGTEVFNAMNQLKTTAGQFDTWSQANQVKINGAMALFTAAQSKYNDINTIQWVDQAKWNTEMQRITDAHAAAIAANTESVKALKYAEVLGRSREPQYFRVTVEITGDGKTVKILTPAINDDIRPFIGAFGDIYRGQSKVCEVFFGLDKKHHLSAMLANVTVSLLDSSGKTPGYRSAKPEDVLLRWRSSTMSVDNNVWNSTIPMASTSVKLTEDEISRLTSGAAVKIVVDCDGVLLLRGIADKYQSEIDRLGVTV